MTSGTFVQLLNTVDQLGPQELAILQARIDQSRRKRVTPKPREYPQEAAELFTISFENYHSMTAEERDALAYQAYKILHRWIDQELYKRHAQWMLVCGGEVLEYSRNLLEYPSPDDLTRVGQERGLIPFVFVHTPTIEESNWSELSKTLYSRLYH